MSTGVRTRPGHTLMEMLCVFALLTLVFGLLATLLMETLRIEHAQVASFERMAQQQALADQFRTDTALAEQAPQEWGPYKAGSHTLILQTKTGHVVYVWQEDKLRRHDFDGDVEHAILLPLDASRVGVEFMHNGAAGGLVKLRLATLRDGSAVAGQTQEIVGALGGDWR
jgi:hypothetical protein